MENDPETAFLNAALKNMADPVSFMELVTDEYLRQDEHGRATLVVALAAEICRRHILDGRRSKARVMAIRVGLADQESALRSF